MTRDEIINQILKPAFGIGLRRAQNRDRYINEHCVRGTNFVTNCSDEAIQNLNQLIVILKEYGYWTTDRRFIGEYTGHQGFVLLITMLTVNNILRSVL